jgi:hypothetical protein
MNSTGKDSAQIRGKNKEESHEETRRTRGVQTEFGKLKEAGDFQAGDAGYGGGEILHLI